MTLSFEEFIFLKKKSEAAIGLRAMNSVRRKTSQKLLWNLNRSRLETVLLGKRIAYLKQQVHHTFEESHPVNEKETNRKPMYTTNIPRLLEAIEETATGSSFDMVTMAMYKELPCTTTPSSQASFSFDDQFSKMDAATVFEVGHGYLLQRDLFTAESILSQALHKSHSEGNLEICGRASANIGLVCILRHQFANGVALSRESIAIFRKIKNKQLEQDALSNAAFACLKLELFDEALGYLLRKMAIDQRETERQLASSCILNIQKRLGGACKQQELEEEYETETKSQSTMPVREAKFLNKGGSFHAVSGKITHATASAIKKVAKEVMSPIEKAAHRSKEVLSPNMFRRHRRHKSDGTSVPSSESESPLTPVSDSEDMDISNINKLSPPLDFTVNPAIIKEKIPLNNKSDIQFKKNWPVLQVNVSSDTVGAFNLSRKSRSFDDHGLLTVV